MFGRMTLQEWRQRLSSVRYKQERVNTKPSKTPAKLSKWSVDLYHPEIRAAAYMRSQEVASLSLLKNMKRILLTAYTKSEARAQLKRMLATSIPPGTKFTKVA